MHRRPFSSARPAWLLRVGCACLPVLLAGAIVPAPAAAVQLYACDDASLYTVDPLTGASTLIGALNPYVTGLLGGLEMADGVLYGLAGTPGNALWRVDPATAHATMIGTGLGAGLIFEGGLAFDGQDLWGVNQGLGDQPKYLIRIDRSTGTAVVVGMIGTYMHDMNGLAYKDGELFGIDRVTNALWNINRVDPTLSYQVGPAFPSSISLGVKGGMAGEYCYADGTHRIFRVDFSTGGAQVLSTSAVYFRSFAPMYPTEGAPGPAAPLRIEGVEPNPTRGETTIRFALPLDRRLGLSICDALGRVVRPLAEGVWTEGSHAVTWDGRDARGVPVPNGVYFIRDVRGAPSAGPKIIVLR